MWMFKQEATEVTEGNGFSVFSVSSCLDTAWKWKVARTFYSLSWDSLRRLFQGG